MRLAKTWAKVLIILVVACLLLPILPVSATDPWYNVSWLNRKKLTLANSGYGVLTDWVVAIPLNATNFDFTKVQADGDDIRFTDSNGLTLIDYFAESWEYADELAIFRIKVPLINDSDLDYVYIYYNNATAVNAENSNNVFTAHTMLATTHKDSTAILLSDATANNNDGTITGASTIREASGLWVNSFDGADDIITVANSATMNPGTADFTIKMWVKMAADAADPSMLIAKRAAVYYFLYWVSGTLILELRDGGNGDFSTTANAVPVGAWHQIIVYRSGGTGAFYIDNINKTSGVPANTDRDITNVGDVTIGRLDNGQYPDKGLVGLPEIIYRALSVTQIAAIYQQEKNLFGIAGNYVTFGIEEGTSIPTNFTLVAVGNGQVNITWSAIPVWATSIEIRRSTDAYPLTPTDGDAIYSGIGTSTSDTSVDVSDNKYYYRAWINAPFGYGGYAQDSIGGTIMLLVILLVIALGATVTAEFANQILLAMIGAGFWILASFAAYIQSSTPISGTWDVYYGLFFICIFVGALTGIFESRHISKKNKVASDKTMPNKVSIIDDEDTNDEELDAENENYANSMTKHREQYNKLHLAKKKERKWRA
jgi:hypothetical protein